MKRGTRVVGLGQRGAGDDAIGLVVLDHLRKPALPADVEIVYGGDAADLVRHVAECDRLVLVDAVVGPAPGEVVVLETAEIRRMQLLPLSSHDLGIAAALDLAGELVPEGERAAIRVVGIGIRRSDCFGAELSPSLAAAVPVAVDRVLDLLRAGR